MLRLSKSFLSEAECEAARSVIERGFLGMGSEVQHFEDELSQYLGGRDVVCVNTGTSALHLALQAIGLGKGDEVLVPTLTYVASFQAISATGATPVACDVRESDGLLDLCDAERRLTPRTKAIMPVHYASFVGNLEATYEFATRHGLRVVEDAAHAFGCRYNERKIGSFGDIVCFSFDGIKNITSGEGGAVVSADSEVVSHVRDARLLGVERDSEKRYRGERSWDFDVIAQGWRYHMSDLMAAIGRVQLKRFETEIAPKRIAAAQRYRGLIDGLPGVQLFDNHACGMVPHIFPIRISNEKRDALIDYLNKLNIQTGIHYKPNHLLAYFGGGSVELPVSEQLYKELLTLPLHPGIGEADVDRVVNALFAFFKDFD